MLAGVFVKLGDKGIDATWARGQISWLAALAFAAMVAATARLSEQVPYATRFIAVWAGQTELRHLFAAFCSFATCQAACPGDGAANNRLAGLCLDAGGVLVDVSVVGEPLAGVWSRAGTTPARGTCLRAMASTAFQCL